MQLRLKPRACASGTARGRGKEFMDQRAALHVLTVGWDQELILGLCDRIAAKSNHSFSHLLHPMCDLETYGPRLNGNHIHWFFDDKRMPLPSVNQELLASLERKGVPSIHNMILSDRVASKLPYEEGLAYASFIAERMISVFQEVRPSVIIGGFDGLHGSMALAVAKRVNIPWYALRFSVLPPGLAGFCESLSPASTISLRAPAADALRQLAENALRDFEADKVKAHAPSSPAFLNPAYIVRRIPSQLRALVGAWRRGWSRQYNKYTDARITYSVVAMLREALRFRRNAMQLPRHWFIDKPPAAPFVFFGLHFQPESSIDVCAHFFSDQVRVIELISRSIPPTHKLLVKLHKSAAAHYSRSQLAEFTKFPGVQLVSPHAYTRELIRKASVVFSIQGTIGLEAALLGKPVVMFADSPTKVFPNVSTIGRLPEFPELVRKKLTESAPERAQTVDAFMTYLAPFCRASLNDWTCLPTDSEIGGYVELFDLLGAFLLQRSWADVGSRSVGS
jgi:hypothetical protein